MKAFRYFFSKKLLILLLLSGLTVCAFTLKTTAKEPSISTPKLAINALVNPKINPDSAMLIRTTGYIMNKGKWELYEQRYYLYDTLSGMLSKETLSDWVDNSWINSYIWTYKYDEKNRLNERLTVSWNSQNTRWDFLDTCFYIYEKDLLKRIFDLHWDEKQNNWVFISSEYFDYDKNGNRILDSNYNYSYKTSSVSQFNYDSTGNMILEEFIKYDTNNVREDYYKTYYYYDASGRVTLSLGQIRIGVSFKDACRKTFEYDANGYNTQILEENFDLSNNTWINSSNENYFYDSTGKKIITVIENWETRAWGKHDSIVYEYKKFKYLDVEQNNENNALNIKIFPNPLKETAEILYQADKAGNLRLSFSSIDGKINTILLDGYVYPGEYRMELDAGKLPSGAYIYCLELNRRKQSGIFIISK